MATKTNTLGPHGELPDGWPIGKPVELVILARVETETGEIVDIVRVQPMGALCLGYDRAEKDGDRITRLVQSPYELVGFCTSRSRAGEEGRGVHDIWPRYAEFLRQAEANGVEFGGLLDGLNIVEEVAERSPVATTGTGQG